MRGDSRHDFYAKAMALCGLGMLAGVGAIVDYWPVAIRFPVATVAVPERQPGPRPVPHDAWARLEHVRFDLTGEPAAAGTVVASRPSTTDLPGDVASHTRGDAARRAAGAPVPVLAQALPVAAAPPTLAGTRRVRELAPPPARVFVRDVRSALPEPQLRPEDLAPGRPVAHGGMAADAADRGVLTSAFRVTGQSLARTGAVTGASLAGAFRRVGSAVRRVVP